MRLSTRALQRGSEPCPNRHWAPRLSSATRTNTGGGGGGQSAAEPHPSRQDRPGLPRRWVTCVWTFRTEDTKPVPCTDPVSPRLAGAGGWRGVPTSGLESDAAFPTAKVTQNVQLVRSSPQPLRAFKNKPVFCTKDEYMFITVIKGKNHSNPIPFLKALFSFLREVASENKSSDPQ